MLLTVWVAHPQDAHVVVPRVIDGDTYGRRRKLVRAIDPIDDTSDFDVLRVIRTVLCHLLHRFAQGRTLVCWLVSLSHSENQEPL